MGIERTTMKLVGAKELDRKLQRMGKNGRKIVGQMMTPAQKVIVKSLKNSIKRHGLVRSGALLKSIGVKRKRYRSTIVSVIGARDKDSTYKGKNINPRFYYHLVEAGVKPHRIPGPVGFRIFGKLVVSTQIDHPGVRGRKFAFKAAKRVEKRVVRVLITRGRELILQEARKK